MKFYLEIAMRKVITKKKKHEAQILTSRGISPIFRNSIPRELVRFRMRGSWL
jgi:hypothetical protein